MPGHSELQNKDPNQVNDPYGDNGSSMNPKNLAEMKEKQRLAEIKKP